MRRPASHRLQLLTVLAAAVMLGTLFGYITGISAQGTGIQSHSAADVEAGEFGANVLTTDPLYTFPYKIGVVNQNPIYAVDIASYEPLFLRMKGSDYAENYIGFFSWPMPNENKWQMVMGENAIFSIESNEPSTDEVHLNVEGKISVNYKDTCQMVGFKSDATTLEWGTGTCQSGWHTLESGGRSWTWDGTPHSNARVIYCCPP